MENRIPTRPGRIKLTDDSGNSQYYTMERADEPTTEGTPLNKATLFDSENESRYACSLPNDALKMLTKEWQVSVPAAGWSSEVNDEGYYTQTINVEGMKDEYSPIFALVLTDLTSSVELEDDFSVVKRMVTYDGYVIFKASEKPSGDLEIRIKGV